MIDKDGKAMLPPRKHRYMPVPNPTIAQITVDHEGGELRTLIIPLPKPVGAGAAATCSSNSAARHRTSSTTAKPDDDLKPLALRQLTLTPLLRLLLYRGAMGMKGF